ncbi:MAG: universal stress protein [Planctomycetes bacterium]|nr:universal stress protein [Planctomycetota bacterium]
MLTSVLLHLDDTRQADPVIRLGVDLASRTGARVRGLTLCDTRRTEAALHCESAVYAVMEQNKQLMTERNQEVIRADLSQACLNAGLNFDVRRISGDPLSVLPQEARYHDLMLTSMSAESVAKQRTIAADLYDLMRRGVQPMLMVSPAAQHIDRVLFAFDGSEASGRAIRLFLNQKLFPQADYRLWALGPNEAEVRQKLREMADYCASRIDELETGIALGSFQRLLKPYVEQWQADLVVLGINKETDWLRKLSGRQALGWLTRLPCSVYAAV